MAEWFEEFRTYLPKYLSADAQHDLFEELKQFPENIDGRLYTTKLQHEQTMYQVMAWRRYGSRIFRIRALSKHA